MDVTVHHIKNDQEYEIRIEIKEAKTVYAMRVGKRHRNWSVRCLNQRPEMFGTTLYCWEKDVIFQTLSSDAVQRSVKSADIINWFTDEELNLALKWKGHV